MDTVIVFADTEQQACYEELATADARIEILPFADATVLSGGRAVGLAIIDSDDDAEAGLLLLGEIKQSRPDVPVIFVTGASSEAVVIRAFKLGARDYFRQPLDVAELEAAVAKILRFKRNISEKRPLEAGDGTGAIPAPLDLPEGIPERLRRSVRYMEQNLERPFSLENVAQVACLSKYHFCRVFKKHVGSSPFQFMLKLRVCRAAVLLRRADLTVSSVAMQAGFHDLSEFNKQFKKITGVTPTAHRKSA
ncbi:MAG TPA: helix-turn-helix domain-containing protein [Geobacteraceae bacterium]